MKYDPFIYGKDQTEGVVSVDVNGSDASIYLQDGSMVTVPNEYYILYASNYNGEMLRLDGSSHYCWALKFTSRQDYNEAVGTAKGMGWDYYTVYNQQDAFLIKSGVTYYKGMIVDDLKVLSFDIETTGLDPNTNEVLMISNTYRDKLGKTTRLFTIDEYGSEKEMIYAWCSMVVDLDPHVILGHNIFGFDLQFLKHRLGSELPIGKMRKRAKTAKYPSQFRKDGSQSYDYTNVLVPGREVIDTFHLSIKYDIGRNYPSYGLKAIVAYEGLEREDRQHYDASTIGDVYKRLIAGDVDAEKQWDDVKKYAEHDADDSLALFDLMIPSFFYYTQHMPMSLQQIINKATGSQVNAFMVRAYLTSGHSLPRSTETGSYQGGISFGHPGIYTNVGKVDVASLYPSIIRQYKVYDKHKDPNAYFLKMVEYFTTERLTNKAKAKETGDRYYRDVEQAQKIVINSAYGFMGAPGLLFNSPENAALITKYGREILQQGIDWAKGQGYEIVNADTDSFSFTTGEPINDMSGILADLNSEFPDMIRWEDDGIYRKFIVVKAKNYVLQNDATGKVTLKGSALKATMKEPALKRFIDDILMALLEGKGDISDIYKDYVRAACDIDMDSIAGWCSKKTITKAVLQPKRTNEQRIFDAIKASGKTYQEGDKIYIFFKSDKELALKDTFNGVYCEKKLLGKLFKTAEIFKPILDMKNFPNLTLKRNQGVLEELKK